MAEAVIFMLIMGLVIILVWVGFGIPYDPRIAFTALILFLLPGFYAAFRAPFVPSARDRQKTMLKLANLQKTDIVYDLGCGDGRLVFSASKVAKKAIGYDLSIPLVLWGKFRQKLRYPKASIHFGNFFTKNYADATVIFCYLLPGAVEKIHREIWPNLRPGTRLICNGFAMKAVQPKITENKVYLYVR